MTFIKNDQGRVTYVFARSKRNAYLKLARYEAVRCFTVILFSLVGVELFSKLFYGVWL